MSQENVELVQRGYAALARGDRAAFIALLDPRVEWWLRPHDPKPGPHRGHKGAMECLASDDQYEYFEREVEEYIDAGEYVIACVRMRGRGMASKVPFEARATGLLRLRDGKVIEIREFDDRAEALEAPGLSE